MYKVQRSIISDTAGQVKGPLHDGEFLFLIRHFDYGGAQRQLISLARAIRQMGGAVRVAVFYPSGPFCRELEKEGIPIVSLEKSSRWDVIGFMLRLARVIRKTKPKVLYSYLGPSNISAVMMKLWFKKLRVVWGVRTSNMKWERYGMFDRLLYWLECKLSLFADVIIANSQSGFAHAVSQGFPKEKMVVVPNGIDVEMFCPDPVARDHARAQLGIGQNELLIGLVGRLDPMKGHDIFLRAASLLVKGRDNIRFVCVGVGANPYRQSLHRLSETLGLQKRMLWLNGFDPIEHLYNALDVMTSSSSYGEGFPNVIGEAMACGINCVATDVGDSRLIIGDAGFVVSPNDVQALVSAWRQVLSMDNSRRAEQGKAARERIVQYFSLEELIDRSIEALNLAGRPRSSMTCP